jgi:hypothetical protein
MSNAQLPDVSRLLDLLPLLFFGLNMYSSIVAGTTSGCSLTSRLARGQGKNSAVFSSTRIRGLHIR